MKIYLATDHAGFSMKETLASFLEESGYEVKDCGAFVYNEDDDYPDFIREAVGGVQVDAEKGEDSRAIIFGGSGQGEAMCANRYSGVRATVYYGGDPEIINLSREHNDANVLSLGARFLEGKEAKEAVRMWLEGDFSGKERHKRRIDKLG